ncbi:hypothetical protein F5Y05DRAFT_418465 [Hypoxylon sp. FL0543]|nr:hypothetical protein F5Y05DRAFT_418465 [Hypoxylon sp. FL0543]
MAPRHERRQTTPDPSEGSDFVTITVPSGKKFAAHAHLLAYHSEYFRRALKSPSQEAATRNFDMSEWATAKTVSCFIRWIYLDTVTADFDSPWCPPEDEDMIKCWLFGDYIQAKGFRNHLMRVTFSTALTVQFGAIHEMWDQIPSNSELRPFLVNIYCRDLILEGDMVDGPCRLEVTPPTLLLEVSKRLAAVLGDPAHGPGLFQFSLKQHLE